LNSSLPPGTLADTLWRLTALSRGGQHWLANANCDFDAVTIAEKNHPVSRQQPSAASQSYVMSPQSAWINYAKEEAQSHAPRHLATLTKIFAGVVFSPLSALLKGAGLDRAATIANRLISTNLYPDWNQQDIHTLTEELLTLYPDRPLIFRNICPDVNPTFCAALQKNGWTLIPARIVYLCDPRQASLWKRNHVKKDARLLTANALEIVPPHQLKSTDLPQLRQLFRDLFIHKHSGLNPDFTPDFFELCLESGFLDLYGLRYQGKWAGVLGIYEPPESNWITTPLIGYDTTLPQEAGIYRCLMALLLNQASLRHKRLHYSSGASQFKRARGGHASLEYTAVYSLHLSKSQRLWNMLFAKTLQSIAPSILKKADKL
jgi:hypothetical protein